MALSKKPVTTRATLHHLPGALAHLDAAAALLRLAGMPGAAERIDSLRAVGTAKLEALLNPKRPPRLPVLFYGEALQVYESARGRYARLK